MGTNELMYHMSNLKLLGKYDKWESNFDNEDFEMLYGTNEIWTKRTKKYFPSSRFQNLEELTMTIRCMQWVYEKCSYGDYGDYNGAMDIDSILSHIKNSKTAVNYCSFGDWGWLGI